MVSRWVGRSLARFEDPPLLTGDGRFVADLNQGARFLRFVRSPIAHGRIRSVEIPDHLTAFTAEDLHEVSPIRPLLHREDYLPIEQPVLASQKVRYVGEPVAVVVADSPEAAEDAAEQVYVDIQPDRPVVNALSALETNAPVVHDLVGHNVVVDACFETGQVAEVFSSADEIVQFDLRSQRQNALPLEARGSIASYDRRTGRITLIASVQSPHVVRTILADLLDLPESDLRVVVPDVGGAFGQKFCLAPEDVVATWVAGRLRATVSWIEDRRENLMSSFHSRDHHYRIRGAFSSEARLLAVDADLVCNIGAYSCYPVTCGVEPLMALAEFPGPYDFRTYRVRSRGVTTNTCPMAPYRGVSRPVITLAMERLMDKAAARFGMESVEIRRRNLIADFPYTSVTGLVYDEGSYLESVNLAAEKIDLDDFRRRQQAALDQGRRLGVGFSVFSERTGYGTSAFAARSMDVTPGFETVDMTMDPSGNVEARLGASPHGQGLETTLAQLIGDRLGVDPSRVRIVHSDTDRTPYGWGTFASRSLVIAGGAARLASDFLRDKLVAIAAAELEAAPEDIVVRDGRATVVGTDTGLEVAEIARLSYHSSHRLSAGMDPGLTSTATYNPAGTFSNACHAAIVEVDEETGAVRVERFVVVEDAGRLINPMIVDGQLHGGITQGIAGALYEEIRYDEEGNILTTSLMDFLPPTMAEIPNIEIHHLETISDATITGAKGLGEGGTIGAPAAIANAVADALRPLEVEIDELPITPARLRRLLKSVEGGKVIG
ncbi:MAG: xanthine dehydrogenase family protein molybdopterin-binding subunit [Acidimicrobiia bacterium]|nr:xanthine dehydrogenase family protein molybdopterin-binding subunit [Acidimicrobiia bacterium]MYH54549.1 xanthine dehydrogenase family protein molybdopterin-binding subunit [Acidimicrobiia bacterium]